jgi:hypothetical protein
MQVRLVLLYHSGSLIQRVYRGHLQRLAFASALRTGCFTTVSDSAHDRAARRARDMKASADRGAAIRTSKTAGSGAVTAPARGHKAKSAAIGVVVGRAADEHDAVRVFDRTPWPPTVAQALACLRLIRLPGPRLFKRAGKQQKERSQLSSRILSSAAPDPRLPPDGEVAAIGISVVSSCTLQLFHMFCLPVRSGCKSPAADSAVAVERDRKVLMARMLHCCLHCWF